MIHYFTALVISYTLGDNPNNLGYTTATIWFEREEHCYELMQSDATMPLYNYLLELYGKDISMRCKVTDHVSSVIKPKLRVDPELQ